MLKTNIFLDLEETIIDDIDNCSFIDENCKNINRFINEHKPTISSVNIFTWGWLSKKEINYQIVKSVEKKLSIKINRILTKEDSIINYIRKESLIVNSIDLKDWETMLYDSSYTKQDSFIDLFQESKCAREFTHTNGEFFESLVCHRNETNILIDDTIEQQVAISNIEGHYHLICDYKPNIVLLNPKLL